MPCALSAHKIPESKFHQFLRRSGVENALGSDGTCALIDRMDPRATGYIHYVKFLDKVRTGANQRFRGGGVLMSSMAMVV